MGGAKHQPSSWQNPTQKALADLVRQLLTQHTARDPKLRQLTQSCQTQWNAFRQTHRHNRPLIRAVSNLLDGKSLLGEIQVEYQFFPGLQTGLELGGPDRFPKTP